MTAFFQIYPEVAGNIADSDFISRTARPPIIEKLKYVFDGWPSDDIISSIGTFIVTDRLKQTIEKENLTGILFDHVEVIILEQFVELYREKKLPKFYWLKVEGDNQGFDFFRSPQHRLIVSNNALNALKQFNLTNAEIEEYRP